MTGTAPDGELDHARAGLYTLLAALLARPPGKDLLDLAAGLEGGATPLGRALDDLAARAGESDQAAAEREFNALFIGVERGELIPYASWYQTGFLHDRPLARLRQDMKALGLERRPGVAEPEDHVGPRTTSPPCARSWPGSWSRRPMPVRRPASACSSSVISPVGAAASSVTSREPGTPGSTGRWGRSAASCSRSTPPLGR
jgi:hypothetical protein